jgi:hypothetical protein
MKKGHSLPGLAIREQANQRTAVYSWVSFAEESGVCVSIRGDQSKSFAYD